MQWLRKYRYIWLLLYFPVYLIAFFLIDRIPAEHYVITCTWDRFIPFNEAMVLPYALWFFWFPGWPLLLGWRALRADGAPVGKAGAQPADPDTAAVLKADFVRLCIVMFTGTTLCLLTYVLWPNAIDLREPIPRSNLFAQAVRLLRETDTPYGVCPSIHILTITAELMVIQNSRQKLFTKTVRVYCWIITLLIAWSTMAIKQHSIVDVIAGAALAAALYMIYEFLQTHDVRFRRWIAWLCDANKTES